MSYCISQNRLGYVSATNNLHNCSDLMTKFLSHVSWLQVYLYIHIYSIFFIIYLSTLTQVVSISWLLCILLQWTWEHRYPFEILISFPQKCTQQWNCWIIWQLYFQFLEEPPYCFPKWPHQFTFLPTVHEHSLFSTPSPTFMSYLFDDSHLTGVK